MSDELKRKALERRVQEIIECGMRLTGQLSSMVMDEKNKAQRSMVQDSIEQFHVAVDRYREQQKGT